MTFSHTLSDQDLVWTITQMGSGGEMLVDIFRVVDGKIVEHWDVLPGMPSANS